MDILQNSMSWLGPLFTLAALSAWAAQQHPSSKRKRASVIILLLVAVSVGALTSVYDGHPLVFIAALSLFALLVVSTYRLIWDAYHRSHIRKSVQQTALWVVVFASWLAVLQQLAWLYRDIAGGTVDVLAIGAITSLLAAGISFLQIWWHIRKWRLPHADTPESSRLPTVTLAIPARNENHALQEALTAALASDYPKLEIIVLDDCSHDATSNIIKSFAHKGVRFIQGQEPSAGWLGKNVAYDHLLREASGEWVLFMGADERLAPYSISWLIAAALENDLDMISVLPLRDHADYSAAFVQPMRYFWQLTLPRNWRKNPPVLSSAWLARRSMLQKAGGFAAVASTILPERYFARIAAAANAYRFILADHTLAISTRKRRSSQQDTARRNTYPLLHRRLELVFAATIAILLLAVTPFVMAPILLLLGSQPIVGQLFLAAAVLFTLAQLMLMQRINPHAWFMGLINFPIGMLDQVLLLWESYFGYEKRTIEWKQRNICLPADVRLSRHQPSNLHRGRKRRVRRRR